MQLSKKRLLILGGGLAVLLSLAGWTYYQSKNRIQYQTARVDRGDIESTISATGNCNAVVTVQVGSQVSGNIKALFADFNSKVKRGQLVARIDPELFQARVDQARANLESAKSQVVNARAAVEKAEADVANAVANVANQKANITRAKSAVADAKVKLDRRLELFQQGILAREDRDSAQAVYDQAVASLEAAQAQLQAAESGVAAARAQREVARTQLASAEALVRQATAALRQAEVDLEHTEIRAPVDGTVIARRMDVGQTVAASFQAPTIFEIAQDLTKMQVDTNVDEADIGRVRVGQPAVFTVDAYPGSQFQGRAVQIRQAPINVQNVITYDVVIAVDNPDLKLFPGITASVKILADRQQNALRIPNAALRFRPPDSAPHGVRGGGSGSVHAANRGQPPMQTVWVLNGKGKPEPARVKLGISDGTYVAVAGGDLKEGQQVIVGVAQKPGSTAAPGFGGRRGFGF